MSLRSCKAINILSLCLSLLLVSCGGFGPSYYPDVVRIEVSAGKGYVDVTIYGYVRTTRDYISEVKVIIVGHDITLIPIALPPAYGGAGEALTPFKKDVHIENLDKGRYTISVIGLDDMTGERILITETVEVE